jgi:GNAT superfamily N-acetyltransferase
MTVRPAKSGDAAAVARIHVETWRDAYAGILPDRVLLRLSESREHGGWSSALLRGESVFVAEEDGPGVVGFGSCGPNRLRSSRFASEVYTLYVAPNHQGCGHGAALLRGMFAALRRHGHETAIIWALSRNPARFFYEAMGGRHVASREERLWGTAVAQMAFGWDDITETQ